MSMFGIKTYFISPPLRKPVGQSLQGILEARSKQVWLKSHLRGPLKNPADVQYVHHE